MEGNHILKPKLIQKHDLLFFYIGLFNKNPVAESETDFPPHNGNELEQQHSSSTANDMMSKDSCASTVLLSCLAIEPELEPQSETDHYPSTSFNDTMYQDSCTNTLLLSCYGNCCWYSNRGSRRRKSHHTAVIFKEKEKSKIKRKREG
jgi:hypothetical protein